MQSKLFNHFIDNTKKCATVFFSGLSLVPLEKKYNKLIESPIFEKGIEDFYYKKVLFVMTILT